ncbi:MAG: protein NO VEIN domain-containing protein [Propylenella sp.]
MFAVGVLYSAQEFLKLTIKHDLHVKDFLDDDRFLLARSKDIIEVIQNCGWVRLAESGHMVVTERGNAIIGCGTTSASLRFQIVDVVACYRPPWSAKLMHGRNEALAAMPPEAMQCFKECGLLDEWNDELTDWWASAGHAARSLQSEALSATGRYAEKLTYEHEKLRIGKEPEWVSRDSSYAGYDVLSWKSPDDDSPLSIEVKGSERPPKQADFVVTRHEAGTAQRIRGYTFHLWYVSDQLQLFVVPFVEVAAHLPTDNEAGRWQQTRIPFAPFREFRVTVRGGVWTRNS